MANTPTGYDQQVVFLFPYFLYFLGSNSLENLQRRIKKDVYPVKKKVGRLCLFKGLFPQAPHFIVGILSCHSAQFYYVQLVRLSRKKRVSICSLSLMSGRKGYSRSFLYARKQNEMGPWCHEPTNYYFKNQASRQRLGRVNHS